MTRTRGRRIIVLIRSYHAPLAFGVCRLADWSETRARLETQRAEWAAVPLHEGRTLKGYLLVATHAFVGQGCACGVQDAEKIADKLRTAKSISDAVLSENWARALDTVVAPF